MQRKIFVLALALGIGMPILGAAFVSLKAGREARSRDALGPVPDFALQERGGSILRREDLLGKVWVASFIFTRCEGACPLLNRKMARLHEWFGKDSHFRTVSFSVDPENDTPETLADYARKLEAPETWLFLTGERAVLKDLLQGGFKVMMPGFENRDTGMITHSNRFALVDRNGEIRGLFDVDEDEEAMIRLKRQIHKHLGRRF